MGILDFFKSLALLGAQLLDWMNRQDLKKLGSLEVENTTLKQEASNAQIASEVDARPTPILKSDVLSRL